MSLYLHAAGHFFPDACITNEFLTDLDIGSDDNWILERVGIRERRTTLPLDYIRETRNQDPRMAVEAAELSCAEMGARAARMALDRAGLGVDDIGLVLACASAPDALAPAQACLIACELGIEQTSFDITSACSSLHATLSLLSLIDSDRAPDYVLVVITEAITRFVDYNDRAAAVLWGDGASAAIFSTKIPGPAIVTGVHQASSPQGAHLVGIPYGGHFQQQGRSVQKFAIRQSGLELRRMRDEVEDLSCDHHFIGHQANLMMLRTICERAEISPERHHFDVDVHGNTAANGVLGVLSRDWESWRPGMDVATCTVGSGLSWGSAVIRFRGER